MDEAQIRGASAYLKVAKAENGEYKTV